MKTIPLLASIGGRRRGIRRPRVTIIPVAVPGGLIDDQGNALIDDQGNALPTNIPA